MRKYILSLFAVLLIVGQAFAATPGFRQNPGTGDILGESKYQADAHKIFRMVRYVPPTYNGATTLSANSIVVWDVTNDDGVTVTTTTTSSDSAVAGITVTQALTPDTSGNTAAQDVGHPNWTWLQTFGYTTVSMHSTLGVIDTAGSAIGTSATAGLAAGYIPSTAFPYRNGNAGFAYDAAATGATGVEVFLNHLD